MTRSQISKRHQRQLIWEALILHQLQTPAMDLTTILQKEEILIIGDFMKKKIIIGIFRFHEFFFIHFSFSNSNTRLTRSRANQGTPGPGDQANDSPRK